MAISSSVYFANRSTPPATLAGGFNKFEKHANPKYSVGHKVETGDGSVYRYAHFGADTGAGKLVAPDFSESGVADTDNAIIAPASAVTTTDGTLGNRYLELTLASATANQYAGAKLVLTDDTGEGHTYDIKGNTATNNPASGNIRVELFQGLAVAVDATTDFAIIPSPYANVEVATAATDYIVGGVSCATMDVSAAAYGWIQTKGIAGILAEGAVTAGADVTLGDGIAGAVQVQDAYTEPIVGFCLDPADDTGYAPIKLNLE